MVSIEQLASIHLLYHYSLATLPDTSICSDLLGNGRWTADIVLIVPLVTCTWRAADHEYPTLDALPK